MTKTVTIQDQYVQGNKKVVIADVDITSYTSGGEPLTPADLGLQGINYVSMKSTENGYDFSYDYTNQKIIARYYDYDAAADGVAIAVPATTDVGTLRLKAEGY